ncbi:MULTISPECIES: CPBP family intramembrane glutamic endopeptidase [Spirulina sp. CCY15215]|uniref:CPBP family intramembrane glutamic endopeptidase n=1 Tax=Spirulina sp. CCY15215 TaxID=2767591 RepID=UPI0019511014|nr:CPBP family intramembrane glutamic endopeptidase [Spirulina major]
MKLLLFFLQQGFESLITADGWVKGIAFFLMWAIAWLPIAFPLAIFLKIRPTQSLTPQQKLPLLASLYAIAPFIIWASLLVSGESLLDYGLHLQHEFFISLGLGIAVGILGLALVFALESRWGWIEWHPEKIPQFGKLLIPILALALALAIIEETIFRGFLFNVLSEDSGLWGGIVFSSLIFALSHLLWEVKDTLPQLPGLVLMGGILALARGVDDGNLGLAWGLHAGWIWGLTCLDSAALISYNIDAPQWFVGLGEKPLAGLAGIACLLLTGIILGVKFAF